MRKAGNGLDQWASLCLLNRPARPTSNPNQTRAKTKLGQTLARPSLIFAHSIFRQIGFSICAMLINIIATGFRSIQGRSNWYQAAFHLGHVRSRATFWWTSKTLIWHQNDLHKTCLSNRTISRNDTDMKSHFRNFEKYSIFGYSWNIRMSNT